MDACGVQGRFRICFISFSVLGFLLLGCYTAKLRKEPATLSTWENCSHLALGVFRWPPPPGDQDWTARGWLYNRRYPIAVEGWSFGEGRCTFSWFVDPLNPNQSPCLCPLLHCICTIHIFSCVHWIDPGGNEDGALLFGRKRLVRIKRG